MASSSRIEWCDATWNPIVGCSPISAGCANCYAARMAHRLGNNPATPQFDGLTVDGKWTGKARVVQSQLNKPLTWPKHKKIFASSMGDLFHHSAYFAWVDLVFARMILAPQHTYIILTKRPDRMLQYLQSVKIADLIVASSDAPCDPVPLPAFPLRNVMLMTTVENQAAADARLPPLLECGAMGWRTGVSVEPMLGHVDLRPYLQSVIHQDEIGLAGREGPLITANGITDHDPWLTGLSWVIAGGETGPGARPMHPDWIRSLRDQCAEAGTPFFFKGYGEWGTARIDLRDGLPAWDVFHSFEHYCAKAPTRMCKGDKLICPDGHVPTSGCKAGKTYPMAIITRIGKRKAGRLLDGREHNDFPESM